jgi:hypothetical protein
MLVTALSAVRTYIYKYGASRIRRRRYEEDCYRRSI